MILDLVRIAWWAVVVSMLGYAAMPITWIVFPFLPGRGMALSRLVGLLLAAWLTWLLASLHLLAFTGSAPWIGCLILILLSGAVLAFHGSEFRSFLIAGRDELFHRDRLFLTVFALFAVVHMAFPDISGTEKLPDFAFLNAVLRSRFFPPADPWFAGETINYFYFGHYLAGFMTRITGTASEIGYNLAVALVMALSFSGVLAIARAVLGDLHRATNAAILTVVAGNLEPVYQIGKRILSGAPLLPVSWFSWWNSSRVLVRNGIDITINEFPYWSFTLGDMHAHLLAMPLLLLTAAAALNLFLRKGRFNTALIPLPLATAPVLGAPAAANTWDYPTAVFLVLLALTAHTLTTEPTGRIRSLIENVLLFLAVTALSLLLYLPFHLHFHPTGAQGVRWLDPAQRSPFGLFFLIHGIFLVIVGFYLVLRRRHVSLPKPPVLARCGWLVPLAVAAATLVLFRRPVIALLSALIATLLILLRQHRQTPAHTFPLLLITLALCLLLACEFVYIKDAYGPPLQRQNTVFKFYYQAWILLATGSGCLLAFLNGQADGPMRRIWNIAWSILLLAAMIYPVLGTSSRAGHPTVRHLLRRMSLDGIRYIREAEQYRGDYEVIHWLRQHAKPGEALLEASGRAFDYTSRISASTGIPTVLGWGNHEAIWRDPTWRRVGERSRLVSEIYRNPSESGLQGLLQKYNVRYIIIGQLEEKEYAGPGLQTLRSLLPVAARFTGAAIHVLPVERSSD